MTALDSFDFEHAGRNYTAEIHHDADHGAPWEEEDGHGPVTDWTRDAKAPGQRLLYQDRHGAGRFYDWQEAMKIARRDGWGLGDAERAALAAELGREPTRGEITAEAVRRDFEHLRDWCNGDWFWCGVVVRRAGACCCCGDSESLWGIESNSGDYLQEVARELAAELAARGAEPEECSR